MPTALRLNAMDTLIGKLGDTLLTQFGLVGVMVVGMGLVIWKQNRMLIELYEKRNSEGQAAVRAMEGMTNAIETLTTLIRDRRRV